MIKWWNDDDDSENVSTVFLPLRRKNHILDLCLGKSRLVKSRDYRDVIVLEKLLFQNVFRPQENEDSLKTVFE